MLFSKFKIYIAAALAAVATVFVAFFSGSKSATNKIKAESEEAAREYERAGYEAGRAGLENEQKVRHEKVDASKRDHFS